jgi:rod shape-determining protein MreD
MKLKILIYTLIIFLIVILQSTLLDYIKIYYIKPNLLIVFIISVALLRGNIEGSIIGFFIGLSQDLISGKVLGFYTILGLYLGLIIGSVNKRLYRENFLVVIFFTFISTIAYEMSVYFLSTFLSGKIDFYYPFKNIVLPEALYNSLISVFVYVLIIKLSDRFNSSKISRKY